MGKPIDNPPRVALSVATLECGGAERMIVNLASAIARLGVPTDLVVGRATGPFLEELPASVRLVDLKKSKMRYAIGSLAGYLRREQPFGLISRVWHTNIVAVLANQLARTDTRILVTEANHLSAYAHARDVRNMQGMFVRQGMVPLMRWAYRRASAVVGVSHGVANDLEATLPLSKGSVQTIPNPVVTPRIGELAQDAPEHPWLRDDGPPVIIAIGRLAEQKDHATLLRAFAMVAEQRPARLIVFGEGRLRAHLEKLRNALGLADVCSLPGRCANPYAVMARAKLLVLSSIREGSPNVLTEALACGCPVVSTDCPSGPNEIIPESPCEPLVPVGASRALGEAILRSLDRSWDPKALQAVVARFSADCSAHAYLTALGYSFDGLKAISPASGTPSPSAAAA